MDTYASDNALSSIFLYRDEFPQETDQDAARELVTALAALCESWIKPLAVSMLFEPCDPDNFYRVRNEVTLLHPAWFLRSKELYDGVIIVPSFVNAVEKRRASIGEHELKFALKEALAQPCPEAGLCVALAYLETNAVAVHLPHKGELKLRYAGGPLEPLRAERNGELFAVGPDLGPLGPPLVVRGFNEHGIMRLSLTIYWDLWIKHPVGRAQTLMGVERVLGRPGWRLAHDSII